MSKTPKVLHESLRLSSDAPACDVYKPSDPGLAATRKEEGSFFIVPGLGSIKTDYAKLARMIAGRGFTVYSPNCNEAVPNSTAEGALERRAEVLTRTIDTWSEGPVRLLPHSLGGPVTIMLLRELGVIEESSGSAEPNQTVVSISFMQPAGFDRHGPVDFFRAAKFYWGEALPRTSKLLPGLLKNPRGVYERLELKQRQAEVNALWNLPTSFMVEGVAAAHAGGLALNFLLGPKDHLTRSGPIRDAVEPIIGADKVIDIHPEAGHLAAQTHPRHVADLILRNLQSIESGVPLLQAA